MECCVRQCEFHRSQGDAFKPRVISTTLMVLHEVREALERVCQACMNVVILTAVRSSRSDISAYHDGKPIYPTPLY